MININSHNIHLITKAVNKNVNKNKKSPAIELAGLPNSRKNIILISII